MIYYPTWHETKLLRVSDVTEEHKPFSLINQINLYIKKNNKKVVKIKNQKNYNKNVIPVIFAVTWKDVPVYGTEVKKQPEIVVL